MIRNHPRVPGLRAGNVVELKFRLHPNGRAVLASGMFVRFDKSAANNTCAALNVIGTSGGAATRDDETRCRAALMWCNTLRAKLLSIAMEHNSARSIVLDVGTGTGQSLDALENVAGVSYILVESDASCAQMLRRRTEMADVITEPRALLLRLKPLKSGSTRYVVLNCQVEALIRDEELSRLLTREVRAVIATFSAQFVLDSLYELVSLWELPLVGCVYPYDGVKTSECLVNSRGVQMRRADESTCRHVGWRSNLPGAIYHYVRIQTIFSGEPCV